MPPRSPKRLPKRGFTLLETSIVLLLFSFVVLGYANLVRTRMEEQRVSLVVAYLNTLLDAALHYYTTRRNEALRDEWTPPSCAQRPGGSGADADYWPRTLEQLEQLGLLSTVKNDLEQSLAPLWESSDCHLLSLRVLVDDGAFAATLASRLPSARFAANTAGKFVLRATIAPPGTQALLSHFYLLNGDRALEGNLQAASHDILNVGLFQGDAVRTRQLIHLSDRRAKKNLEALPATALQSLDELRAYRFRWRDPGAGNLSSFGLVAQETELVFPELVHQHQNQKGIDYVALQALMLARLQEQQQRLQALEQHCKPPTLSTIPPPKAPHHLQQKPHTPRFLATKISEAPP